MQRSLSPAWAPPRLRLVPRWFSSDDDEAEWALDEDEYERLLNWRVAAALASLMDLSGWMCMR